MVGQPFWSATTVSRSRVFPTRQHGAHEVPAGRRIHPGGAQHDGARAGVQHRCLAGELARAVDALRRHGVGLDVGLALGAIEHIVGRDVDQWDAGRRA